MIETEGSRGRGMKEREEIGGNRIFGRFCETEKQGSVDSSFRAELARSLTLLTDHRS